MLSSGRQFGLGILAASMLPAGAGVAEAWCVTRVARDDVLQVRVAPTAFSPVVVAFPPRTCGIKVVGLCYGGWCPVSYRGYSGWSNSYYLVSQTLTASARPDATRAMPATRGPAMKKVAAAPRRPAPTKDVVRDVTPEPERPKPVAAQPRVAPATPGPPPEPRSAPVDGSREVCIQGVAKGDTLKVRAGPSAGTDLRYGFLPDTCGVKVTGECKDSWCPVEYRGYKGWAEERFLK